MITYSQLVGMVYTSYKREGESVFAFPEGCPEGGPKGAKRAGPPRDSPRGRQTQTLPTSCRRYIILFYHVFFIQTQRYDHTFPLREGKYETFETQEIYDFFFYKNIILIIFIFRETTTMIFGIKNFQRFSFKVTL